MPNCDRADREPDNQSNVDLDQWAGTAKAKARDIVCARPVGKTIQPPFGLTNRTTASGVASSQARDIEADQCMAIIGEITHTTTYRYAKPVTFGTHRAMFLPRRGSSTRLLRWSARPSLPSKVHWVTDSRSNAVTVMEFSEPGSELTFTFKVRGIYFGIKGLETFPLEPRAEEVPVQYTPDEWTDLAGYLRPHADDADGSHASWTKSFVAGDQDRPSTCCPVCWACSAASSAIAEERPKAPNPRAKHCARDQVHAGTSPG